MTPPLLLALFAGQVPLFDPVAVSASAPFLAALLKALIVVLVPVFLVSGLDDFFIDVFYGVRSLYRRIFVLRKADRLTVEDLRSPPEKPVAVMVPAWDEAGVVASMLRNALRTLDYGDYHLFVGTYPNDPATEEEVDRLAAESDRVQRVRVGHDGPTSKADCLNHLHAGVRRFEREHGVRFDVFAVFDAEDIVHPLSLRLFNFLIPRKDMVQLPVFPLEAGWRELTAGHYMDEFAENHQKDLVVREFLSGSVPSAGTGCAFSREVMDDLSDGREQGFFDASQLTEDYEVGLRLGEAGYQGVFVKQRFPRAAEEGGGRVGEWVATREYFPRTFRAAVRQKARWVLGIVFQGWERMGWRREPRLDYMLLRDRKSVVTSVANVLGYVVVAGVGGDWIVRRLAASSTGALPLIEPGSWLWYGLLVVTFFLAWRVLARVYWVERVYGWRQALMAAPRLVWGNLINFAATLRAMRLYALHRVRGEPLAWEATDHRFPSEEELEPFRRRLGDLLLERRLVSQAQLEDALREQREDGRRLGEILLDRGWVEEDDIIQVLSVQMGVEARAIDPYETPEELLRELPERLAVRHSVYPLGRDDAGRMVVATNGVPSREKVRALERALGVGVDLRLAARSDVSFAIRRGYARLRGGGAREGEGRLLGERLVEEGWLSRAALEEALLAQRRSHVRLGDLLLEQGALRRSQLEEALAAFVERQEGPERLGRFLVRRVDVEETEVERALERQRRRFRRLGEILRERDLVSDEALEEVLDGEG